jgi:hypothetical protein
MVEEGRGIEVVPHFKTFIYLTAPAESKRGMNSWMGLVLAALTTPRKMPRPEPDKSGSVPPLSTPPSFYISKSLGRHIPLYYDTLDLLSCI